MPLLGLLLCFPGTCLARMYIDINAPSIRKFSVAIPEFKPVGDQRTHPEFAEELPGVISNDLDLSGYFSLVDKGAFLEDKNAPLNLDNIQYRSWTVIGAELLVKGTYACIGQQLEVELRVYDTFQGRQIMGKRVLGEIRTHRRLMHRLSNDIVRLLTGYDGIFLTQFAFVGTTTGQKEIYVCDCDGYNLRQITADKSIALLPRWSPDGKVLAFNSYKEGSGPSLFMKDLTTGSVGRISEKSGLNIGAAWAPDGSKMALTMTLKGNPDIFLIDSKGKPLKQLTTHWGIDVSPSFSPDGKKLAFVSNRSGNPQIYVLDLDSGEERRLTFEGNYNTSPSWSSSNRIAYTAMRSGAFDICSIDGDGGGPRKLTDGNGNNEDPCWSPDGRYIAFSSNRDGRYQLYLMNGNGQNQKKITNFKGDQTAPSWTR